MYPMDILTKLIQEYIKKKELVIVTGASRGIGKAIALRFSKDGKDVMIFGRDVIALEAVQKEILKYERKNQRFAPRFIKKTFRIRQLQRKSRSNH